MGEVEDAVDHFGFVGGEDAGAGAFAGEVEEFLAGDEHFVLDAPSVAAGHGPAQEGVHDEAEGAEDPRGGEKDVGEGDGAAGGGGLEPGLGDVFAEDENDHGEQGAGDGGAGGAAELFKRGTVVNHKRVLRLMRAMNIASIAPGPQTSVPHPQHKKYPYLLRNVPIVRPDQVWCTDITYLPMARGHLFLVAILDWYSRHVLAWRLSNTCDVGFCLEALDEALSLGRKPEIFNSDQGSQFTSEEFTGRLLGQGIQISMDGKGRALDNVIVERFWRNVKYEYVYLHAPATGLELHHGLKNYMDFYCHRRGHETLQYAVPSDVYDVKKTA